jgi:FimV-like protein
MSNIMYLEGKRPATMEGVVEAITRLSTLSESQILELVSAGKIKSMFPFRVSGGHPLPADFVDEEDLIEASVFPLNPHQRRELIRSSVPASQEQPVEFEAVTMSEVGSRLDLARYYFEIGDVEGARSILEEIVQEGTTSDE